MNKITSLETAWTPTPIVPVYLSYVAALGVFYNKLAHTADTMLPRTLVSFSISNETIVTPTV